jgi:hypothetical protein
MGVVYAPPGSSSSVTYTNSEMVGSTNALSVTNGSSNTATASVSVGGGWLDLFSSKITYSFSDTWGTSGENSNSVSVQTTQGNSVSTMGPISSSLGVDHDNDIIYIWLNPVTTETVTGTGSTASLNWTGLSSNSCDLNDPSGPPSIYQGFSGCDPNQYPYPDIVGIPVWCLKNPYYPNPGCSQWLPYTSRSWDLSSWGVDANTGLPLGPGLTMRDYADILQADPFVVLNGNAINVCHPTYGPSLDPNLTETISSVPLTPPQVAALPAAGPAGVAGPRVNFADPIDPNYASTATTPPTSQPTGLLPSTCLTPNTTNITNGTTTTAVMNRFQPYGTVEYPVPGPNGLPSTYSGKFEYSTTNVNTTVATDTHTVSNGVSVEASGTIPLPYGWWVSISASAGYTNTSTWQQQSSLTNTSGKTAEADYAVTGPQLSDNYVGPATYNVYFDSVYGTYAFYSDLEPPVTPAELGNIGINISGTNCTVTSATPCLTVIGSGTNSSVVAGTSSGLYPVKLTNNSQFPITMVGPAITFSDPGFLLDETDGTDTCSNQMMQPGGYCTANIFFTPTPSDAPISIYGPSVVVNSDIIAAGTVNISSTTAVAAEQNILMTNYALVRATVTGSSQGATLVPVESPAIVLSKTNPPPYIYSFGQYAGTPLAQPFIFTNNFNAPVLIGQVTLSDNVDYSIASTNCSPGLSVAANGGTCTITVNYAPPYTTVGLPPTSIAVTGTVPSYKGMPAWYNGESFQLAVAGAIGTPYGSVTVSAPNGIYLNYVDVEGPGCSSTYPGGNPTPKCQSPTPYYITVTNTTPSAATLTFTADTSNGFSIQGGASGSASVAGHSSGQILIASNVYCNASGESTSMTNGTCLVYNTYGGVSDALDPSAFTLTVTQPLFGTNKYTYSASASYYDTWVPVYPNIGAIPVTITGVEQSTTEQVTAAPATGTLTLSAVSNASSTSARAATAEAARRDSTGAPSERTPARLLPVTPTFVQSTLSVGVGGFTQAVNVPFGTAINDAAATLAAQLNAAGSPVQAVANGSTITLTSLATGSAANLPLSAFVIGNYQVTPSGTTLTGGRTAGTTTKYDSGTVQLTTNGLTASAPFGSTSTPQSIAVALAASVNQVAGAYWNATAKDGVLTLTSVSNASTNASTAFSKPGASVRRAITTAKRARTATTTADSEADAATSTTSNQVVVTVIDSAGFAQPSFSAATN